MTRTPAEVLGDAGPVLTRLITGSDVLSWQWDSRFSAALSVVKAPNDLPVLELVGGIFPNGWDHKSIGAAPDSIRAIATAWGGLNLGQRLFSLDPADDPLFFAAWWPWGGGTTFSLRVGCTVRDPGSSDPVAELRRWFSLVD